MKRLIKILLCVLSVIMINVGFALPIVHYFWNLSGYDIVNLIPRWVGREFYILILIPTSSVSLVLGQVFFWSKKQPLVILLLLLDFSLVFSIYEIANTSLKLNSELKIIVLPGYYVMALGIVLLNTILLVKWEKT